MKEYLFTIDGETFDVEVVKLEREFVVSESAQPRQMADGSICRMIDGTYIHYTMTVRSGRNPNELEAFWEKISRPASVVVCRFPYGRRTISQKMYVQKGSQQMLHQSDKGNRWGEITIRFLAQEFRSEV